MPAVAEINIALTVPCPSLSKKTKGTTPAFNMNSMPIKSLTKFFEEKTQYRPETNKKSETKNIGIIN